MKSEQEARALVDCTFKPIVNKSRNKSVRNVNEFVESQQKHLEKIQDKNEDLKKRIEEEGLKNMTFSPRINKKKIERNKENVHERLYRLKDKDKDLSHSCIEEKHRHVPKITSKGESLVRAIPVDELLYMDALRRAEKSQSPVPERQEGSGYKNQLQEKYAAQKLLKDFKGALEATQLKEKTIYGVEELSIILREMGYIGVFDR